MSKSFEYLIYFSVYALVILVIGKSSFGESDSIFKFFVGERRTGFVRLLFTFVGTWISAATILGYTGNVYENGTSVIAVTVIPWFIGAVMLYLISGKIYDYNVMTIPQLIGDRYQSRGLRAACGFLLSAGYVLYLVIQIKGFGIAAARLLNIDYKVAVFLVYLFILYSTFGGFNSVTKTDGCNLFMLTASIVIIYAVIVGQVDGSWLLSSRMVESSMRMNGVEVVSKGVLQGETRLMFVTMFFGWGMGLATNPQYLIRIVAARDKRTAKRMIVSALLFLTFFYFFLTQIGLGLRILFPYLDTYCGTDELFIFAIDRLIQSRFSGFFLISVIGACISTANSQLLLIGSMMSYDVAAQFGSWGKNEDRVLMMANLFIFLGGTLALVLSLDPPADILFFGADIWGLFSVILTPLVYGTLYYRGATREGAVAAFTVGVTCAYLFWGMELPVYWGFPGTLCSTAVFLLVPVFERWKNRSGEEETG